MTRSPAAPVSYLALGDSYTIGQGVAEAERWPNRLAAALRKEGVAVSSPRIIASTGWTTGELLAALDAATPLGSWQLVSLLIGVNNQYRGLSLAGYGSEFQTLLDRAIELAHGRAGRVLTLSIPDWGVTPFARAEGRDRLRVAAEIDAFNRIGRQASRARGAVWIDITGLSRTRGAEPAMLTADGLHPSGAMYALWVGQALPAARRSLSAT